MELTKLLKLYIDKYVIYGAVFLCAIYSVLFYSTLIYFARIDNERDTLYWLCFGCLLTTFFVAYILFRLQDLTFGIDVDIKRTKAEINADKLRTALEKKDIECERYRAQYEGLKLLVIDKNVIDNTMITNRKDSDKSDEEFFKELPVYEPDMF